MPKSLKQFAIDAHHANRTPLHTAALAIAALIEPFYAAIMRLRNFCYDRQIFRSHDLGRFTISVGNITTGGTGKTPVVIWLANRLRERGRQPAILLRGYASTTLQGSDEAMLMDQSLNAEPTAKIPIRPDPSRVKSAAMVLAESPQVDLFLLDDAFQHRRARRDFNLVLISATQPFGRGRVLPRGFLREPMAGLARADAFVITRCASVSAEVVTMIETVLRRWKEAAPIYHADHSITQVRLVAEDRLVPTQFLAGKKVFFEASIADPASLQKQIAAFACEVVATGGFDDHHSYTQPEIERLVQTARTAGAELIVTTEKDWVKIRGVIQPQHHVMFAVTKLDLVFRADDGDKLIEQIQKAIESSRI